MVPFPLRFDGCEFDTAPVVEGAQLFDLALTGSPRLPGLLGNGLRVRRDLDLSRSHIAGAHWTSASTAKRAAVWLCESEISGRLLCLDTVLDGQGDRALQADRIRVGGAVRLLNEFHSRGEIRLIGARISGTLDLSGAHIDAPGGPALNLEDAVLEGSMFLIESSAERPAGNTRRRGHGQRTHRRAPAGPQRNASTLPPTLRDSAPAADQGPSAPRSTPPACRPAAR